MHPEAAFPAPFEAAQHERVKAKPNARQRSLRHVDESSVQVCGDVRSSRVALDLVQPKMILGLGRVTYPRVPKQFQSPPSTILSGDFFFLSSCKPCQRQ